MRRVLRGAAAVAALAAAAAIAAAPAALADPGQGKVTYAVIGDTPYGAAQAAGFGHRASNGGYTPTERLDVLRSIFFPVPGARSEGTGPSTTRPRRSWRS